MTSFFDIIYPNTTSRTYFYLSDNKATAVPPLSAELGCVFHQIECLSKYARIYPDESLIAKVGAFVPANFLASFASMPEAHALALLDGNPAAVGRARRPEAFFRFLLIHLDKELTSRRGGSKIIDSLHGFTFVSVNEFITGSGPPTTSKQHAMTVDLAYDPFVKNPEEKVKFGEVLRHALSKESRLRAWCQESRSYETVVQRKIATSLPTILALSCCCAGRHNEEGLSIWRTNGPENGHWLPEFVEVEIEDDGNVVVREMIEEDGASGEAWMEFKGTSLSPAVADIVKSSLGSTRKHRYRLDAVLSFVRDNTRDDKDEQVQGHHVLHTRVSFNFKRQAYEKQRVKTQLVASTTKAPEDTSIEDMITLTSGIKEEVFQKRIEDVEERIKRLDELDSEDEWILFNGFVVSSTVSEDARAFHVSFKDPCLVIFRAVDQEGNKSKKERKNSDAKESNKLGLSVMQTKSIYSGRKPEYTVTRSNSKSWRVYLFTIERCIFVHFLSHSLSLVLPGQGDLIAFDAEFVSVQEEESILDERGSKVTIREGRLALARMSVIDCRSGTVILDDYILPCEPVVDYLTRFSGITASDLDPKTTPHHLISMQSAYLKLRYLTERRVSRCSFECLSVLIMCNAYQCFFQGLYFRGTWPLSGFLDSKSCCSTGSNY